MCFSVFGNVSCAKTYPGILNISVSVSIAYQSIDILNFSNEKFGFEPTTPVWSAAVLPLRQKPKIITLTGHKKLDIYKMVI